MPISSVAHRSVALRSTTSSGMLSRGSTGPQVLALQRALAALGFNPHGFDGKFGPKTEAALRAFQRSAAIVVDGKAGPQTWGALKARGATGAPSGPPTAPGLPTLKPGARGDFVKIVQAELKNRGYAVGPVDGDYGPMTLKAVSAFQRAHGLAGSGTIGPRTWALLADHSGGVSPGGAPSTGLSGMLSWAKSMIGSPYAAVNPFRFGEVLWDGKPHKSVNGSGTVWNYPAGTRVFDCSGFVVAAFKKLGVNLLAKGLASTAAMRADTSFLQPISSGQLRAGDLILYTPKNGIGHVVIYLGNGQCIEAAGGVGVVQRAVDWSRVHSYRRVPLPG